MTVIRTIPAPAYITTLAARSISEYSDGRWVCHPESYDPAAISEEAAQEDQALWHLSLAEIEQVST